MSETASMGIATSRWAPDNLRGLALQVWKYGAWHSVMVDAARRDWILDRYPPEREWGRPGILASEMRTLMRGVSELSLSAGEQSVELPQQ